MSLKIKLIHNFNDFQLLENDWKKLEIATNQRNITSSFDYLINWWICFKDINEDGNFGYNKELLILFLYNEDELLAIVPLVKLYRKKFGLKIKYIEFLSQQWGAAFLDIIAIRLDSEQIKFIVDWIYENEKFDVLQLKHIPEDSCLIDIYNKDITVLSACPEIDLRGFNNFEDFKEKIFSKNVKQNFRKAINKITKNQITYEEKIFNSINNELFSLIAEISRSKLIDDKESIYLNPSMRNFCKALYTVFPFSLVVIYLNNKPVAYRTNLFYKNMKMCFDAAYDREYKEYNLGAFSVNFSINESFEKKIQFHSEGPGVDFYKLHFCKKLYKIYTLTRKGNTFLSYFIYKKAKLINLEKQEDYLKTIDKYNS